MESRDGLPRGVRLAVDVGSVRVGVAASDPDGLIATPVATVARDQRRLPPQETATDVAYIAAEVVERSALAVYVGLPRHLSGGEGSASQAARAYADTLAHAITPVEVWLVDERLSTVSAHQALHASGRAGRRHRSVVDQAAAVVILQTALDSERSRGHRSGERVVIDVTDIGRGPEDSRDVGSAERTEGTTE